MRYPFASMIIEEIAPSMGVTVELEPEFKFAGEIIFPNGERHLFRNTNFNVNPAGSTEIARDKNYTSFFLKKHKFNVPVNKTFFSERLNVNLPVSKRRTIKDAIDFAYEIGLPVYVKPNNLSQGAFVTKVYSLADIPNIAFQIFERTDVMLIEEACYGKDFRVVILGNKVISAYQRIPLCVIGDGENTIEQLLKISKNKLNDIGRPNAEINLEDVRIEIKLKELGKCKNTIPKADEKIVLLDNANLSTGGTSVDVTETIHDSFAEISIKATRAIGLRLCGVDIICDDITLPASDQIWNIIELNAAPGLDNYSSLGVVQAERVKNLYKEILQYLSEVVVQPHSTRDTPQAARP